MLMDEVHQSAIAPAPDMTSCIAMNPPLGLAAAQVTAQLMREVKGVKAGVMAALASKVVIEHTQPSSNFRQQHNFL